MSNDGGRMTAIKESKFESQSPSHTVMTPDGDPLLSVHHRASTAFWRTDASDDEWQVGVHLVGTVRSLEVTWW